MTPLERWLRRADVALAHLLAVAGLFYLIIAIVIVFAMVLVNAITGG